MEKISVEDFIEILNKSTLRERLPVNDKNRIKNILDNSNLLIGAYLNQNLVGIVRCVTDFYYCCYISDLAVYVEYQNKGIGKQLIEEVKNKLMKDTKIVLLAAPNAINYYSNIGFEKSENSFLTKV
ncbi:GNAT family N-acetyltransferase [Gemella sp. zg-1178]|uniref:GNAT family N-acetyltransferase n=1 Tax=Gemella sp. zg-1178 TaxID=2840372 RepID=UPI00352FF1E4